MTDENPQLTIDFKRWGIVLGVISTLIGILTVGTSAYSDYHAKFATTEVVEDQINDLNVEIITLALLGYEDELTLIEFKQANGESTQLDIANKEILSRRIRDLKQKLSKIEQ